MWFRTEPRSDAERRVEIARLEGVRDQLLGRAPWSLAFQPLLAPIMFAAYLTVFGGVLLYHREKADLIFVTAAIAFGLLFGRLFWKSWMRPPAQGDRWGMADRLGYEGDSPREVQAKIDRLRAQLESRTTHEPQ